jgi:hypothetical protein
MEEMISGSTKMLYVQVHGSPPKPDVGCAILAGMNKVIGNRRSPVSRLSIIKQHMRNISVNDQTMGRHAKLEWDALIGAYC